MGFEDWEALIARNDDPDRNWIFLGIILFNPIKRNVLLLVKIFLPTDDWFRPNLARSLLRRLENEGRLGETIETIEAIDNQGRQCETIPRIFISNLHSATPHL